MDNPIDYMEITPPGSIAPFVKCFWRYNHADRDIRHTILPNGCFELFATIERQNPPHLFLSGLHTEPYEVFVPEGVTVVSIRFKLAAVEHILKREIGSLLNRSTVLEPSFLNLGQSGQLSFVDWTDRIIGILDQLLDKQTMDPGKLLLLEIAYNPGLNVTAISEATKWDRRKINRYFNRQFGLSLKTFLNITRFRASFPYLKAGTLYPELDYYDQAHFIKEIRKYSGKQPGQLAENRDDRFLQFSVNNKS